MLATRIPDDTDAQNTPFFPPAEPLRCGWSDLDAASAIRPGAVTLVDYAGGATSDVLYAYMADAAILGRLVLVADGANFLDVYRLAAAARRRAASRLPDASRATLAALEEAALDRVRIARGFTAHQLQSIVEYGLVREADAEVGLIVAPGLFDMHLDDELSREEARALAGRALGALRRLAARLEVPVVVANKFLDPASTHPLRILLEEATDETVLLQHARGGGLNIQLPRRGASFLAPAPGRTRLEDFLDGENDAAYPAPLPRAKREGPWVSGGHRMMGRFGEQYRRASWAVHEAREAA